MSASFPSALTPFLDSLHCPICADRLEQAPGALRCPKRHTFNIARQGYVSLLAGTRATSGDDAAMIHARNRFLATGAYEPIRRVVSAMASRALPLDGAVVDVGCGNGYYLAGVLDQLPGAHGLGLDSSVRALRSAARAHERAAAASWDVFRPYPLADHTMNAVLNVFAPRNPTEFHRVLHPTGRLIVVRPTADHLAELRRDVPGFITIDASKEQRLHDVLAPFFEHERDEHLDYITALEPQAARDLLGMTPSARHVTPADLPNDNRLPTQVTVSVLASSYLPRQP
ncbi:hypothetical protein QFE97_08770 [Bacillus subtilis]|nr:hypothetical protein QFE97_08770 [Bacillus subtilis]